MDKDAIASIVAQVGSENEAYSLIHAIRDKFDMVGSEFSRLDMEEVWNDGRMEDESEFTDLHWEICTNSRTWYRVIQDQMIEAGWAVINDLLLDEIDALVQDDPT